MRSLAGHDEGSVYVVLCAAGANMVLVANGANKTVDKPKRKKLMHLQGMNAVCGEIREKLIKNQKVDDVALRTALKAFER